MSQIINAAFCGAGNIVRNNHLPSLENRPEKFAVSGFYDLFQDNANELAGTKYKTYATYEELLADDGVNIVVIATKPLTTHFPAAKQALQAGKHVLLEKPMAETSAQCDELIALAEKHNLVLTVHHNRRLDLDFLALREVIKKGCLGDLRLIENRVPHNNYKPTDLVDWCVHLVDQAFVLNPAPLTEVSAVTAFPDKGLEDGGYLDATLRFAEGPLVRIAMLPRPAEYLINGTPPLTRFYAAGTQGAFVQRIIEDPRDLLNATQNFDNAAPDYKVPDFLNVTRKEFYDYLYESLTNKAPLLVRPQEARNAIRGIELISESAKSNRTIKAGGFISA